MPGLIEGSGVNPKTLPPNLGELPIVYSDAKAMHLLLQVHFRINTALLMLHRPFSHTPKSDITALNAAHNIVQTVVMLVQASRKRGDTTMLRRRQLWVVLYGALCLMSYQASLYPIEPCDAFHISHGRSQNAEHDCGQRHARYSKRHAQRSFVCERSGANIHGGPAVPPSLRQARRLH